MDTMKNNFLDFFSALSFQSDIHKYFVKGVPINRSVSALIKDYCLPFNSHALSLGVAKKRGITQAEVLAEWKQTADEAIQKGNQAHLFGELYPFNRGLRPQSQYDIAIMKFWSDLPEYIIPVTMELQMYHIEKMYAGTADIILYNTKTKRYIIGDVKTNKDLFKNFKRQKLTGRFNHLLDTPLNKYQIQLSYYQILLEQTEVEVSHRKVIWLLPDGTYKIYECEDLTQYLK
jgi:hypothetical protein